MAISKLHQNHSARASFEYVVSKAGARVIGGNVAPWIDRNDLSSEELQRVVAKATSQYMMACNLIPLKRPIYQASLSLRPDEDLSDSQFFEMAEQFLSALILTSDQPDLLKKVDDQQLGLIIEKFREEELHKYQHTIVRHTNEPHPHVHIVWAKTNLETEKAHSTSFDRYRAQTILRHCERQHGLIVQPNSWEVDRSAETTRQIRKESATGISSKHKQLQEILDRAAASSRSVCDFIENAQAEGVEVRVQFTRTGKSKGISYGLTGDGIAGSTLGTRYSFSSTNPGLVKNLGLDYDPERDNAQIQELCKKKPLSLDQRQQQQELDSSIAPTLPPDAPTPVVTPLTLAQAGALTPQKWTQLTPGQQIPLVQAARSHQGNEPRVNVRVEQWVGQAKQLQRQVKESQARYVVEKKSLQELENRGQRSLLNPFGVADNQLENARSQFSDAKSFWLQTKRDWEEMQARQKKRQEQESGARDWAASPDAQGAKHITELLQQPELRSQYERVERTISQFGEWRSAAEQLGRGAELKVIGKLAQDYLSGKPLPEQIERMMREELQQQEPQQINQGFDR